MDHRLINRKPKTIKKKWHNLEEYEEAEIEVDEEGIVQNGKKKETEAVVNQDSGKGTSGEESMHYKTYTREENVLLELSEPA